MVPEVRAGDGFLRLWNIQVMLLLSCVGIWKGTVQRSQALILHLEITLSQLCFQHAGLMSPLLGRKTAQGQTKGSKIPSVCPLRLQCNFFFIM